MTYLRPRAHRIYITTCLPIHFARATTTRDNLPYGRPIRRFAFATSRIKRCSGKAEGELSVPQEVS